MTQRAIIATHARTHARHNCAYFWLHAFQKNTGRSQDNYVHAGVFLFCQEGGGCQKSDEKNSVVPPRKF